jgi:hypothetical protein
MNDSIAVVAAKIGKRASGRQFGEPKRTARQTISSPRARHEAYLRGPKQLTY